MNQPEDATLGERSLVQKATDCRIPLTRMSRRGKSIETGSRLVVARDRGFRKQWGGRAWGGCLGVHFWRDENVQKLIVVMAAQL